MEAQNVHGLAQKFGGEFVVKGATAELCVDGVAVMRWTGRNQAARAVADMGAVLARGIGEWRRDMERSRPLCRV